MGIFIDFYAFLTNKGKEVSGRPYKLGPKNLSLWSLSIAKHSYAKNLFYSYKRRNRNKP